MRANGFTTEDTENTEKSDWSLQICHLKFAISDMANDKLQICNDQLYCSSL